MFWILAGIISALIAIIMATPAMNAQKIKAGWIVSMLCGLVPMALYLWLGRPEFLN